MEKKVITEIKWPIGEVGVNPGMLSAKPLLDIGLPDYLQDCLDGHYPVYLAAQFLSPPLAAALKKMFAGNHKGKVKKGWQQLWRAYKHSSAEAKVICEEGGILSRGEFFCSVINSLESALTFPEDSFGPFAFMTEAQVSNVKKSLYDGKKKLDSAFGSDGLTDKDNAVELLYKYLSGRAYELCNQNPKAHESAHQAMQLLIKAKYLFDVSGIEVHVRDLLENYRNAYVESWKAPIQSARPKSGNYHARLFSSILAEDLADLCGRNVPAAVESFTHAIFDEPPKKTT